MVLVAFWPILVKKFFQNVMAANIIEDIEDIEDIVGYTILRHIYTMTCTVFL